MIVSNFPGQTLQMMICLVRCCVHARFTCDSLWSLVTCVLLEGGADFQSGIVRAGLHIVFQHNSCIGMDEQCWIAVQEYCAASLAASDLVSNNTIQCSKRTIFPIRIRHIYQNTYSSLQLAP